MTGLEPAAARTWRTRANLLTAGRLALAPVVAAAVLHGAAAAATLCFAAAVASDVLDGRVARRLGEASPLGGLLDHATDAIFVAAGLSALAVRGEVPGALPVLVIAAFTQYALDSRALAGRPLRTSRLGRANGIAYYVLLAVPLVRDAVGLGGPPARLVSALGWLLVGSSLLSMADRALALRRATEAG
jgi:cardiolipin synthase